MIQNGGTYDEAVTGSKEIFFPVFYFWKVYNKLQGYAYWKCKKVKNQPTLLYSNGEFSPVTLMTEHWKSFCSLILILFFHILRFYLWYTAIIPFRPQETVRDAGIEPGTAVLQYTVEFNSGDYTTEPLHSLNLFLGKDFFKAFKLKIYNNNIMLYHVTY
jgi:hypothetical protein